MDFVRYAERAARLVNTPLADRDEVPAALADRRELVPRLTDRDRAALRRFTREVRPVFEAAERGEAEAVVDRLNALLARHPVRPYIAGNDAQAWQLHVGGSSVAELLIAEALMGLSGVVCDPGASRLGVCSADGCADVFVDLSPNQSRRFCSDRCASRAHVAAYRARRRAESQPEEVG